MRDDTEATTPRGDLEWVSIPRLVDASSEAFGDADAIIDGDVRLTFRELAVEMRRSARAAIAAGLAPGDRAAIWAENRVEWVVAALGVQAAGGVIVPVSTRFKGDEAAWVLRRSGARLLFTVGEFLGVDYVAMLRSSAEAVPDLQEIVVLGDGPADTRRGRSTWPVATGSRRRTAEARLLAVGPDDVADILFTSGTTGRPKGAMTTHGQNLRVFEVYTRALGLRAGDRYLVVNPFFHSFGYKAGWLSSIIRGATVYPWPVFDVDAVLDVIERERISVLPGPPTLLQEVLDAPSRDDHDLSSLRLTITGSASVPVEPDPAAPRRDELRDGADRLRPDRDERGRVGQPPRRRPGAHRRMGGTAGRRHRGEGRRRRRARGPDRRAGRAARAGLQRDARVLGRPRRHRGDHRRRRVAAHR